MTTIRHAGSDLTVRTWQPLMDLADADRRGVPWEPGCPEGPWPEDRGVEDAWLLLAEAERARRAASLLVKHLEGRILTDVQAHGEIRLGNDVYYPQRETVLRWAYEGAQADLLRWAAGKARAAHVSITEIIGRLVRVDPKAVRLTELRHLDPAAEDTFLERPDKDPEHPKMTLGHHVATLSTAPKWAKGLQHGERRPPRKAATKEPDDA